MPRWQFKADRFVNLKLKVIKRSLISPYGENYYGPQRARNFMHRFARFPSSLPRYAKILIITSLFRVSFKIYIE